MRAMDRLVDSGMVEENVPLGPRTTYKSGGPARYWIEVERLEALRELAASGAIGDMPTLVLGRGSNLVVADRGFPGLVVKLGAGFSSISIASSRVTAGAAATLARVARASVQAGLTGLEFFVGVPGSVGGAVRQNAGCFDTETSDRLIVATLLDLTSGELVEKDPEDLDLAYRHSNVSSIEVVVEAVFEAKPGKAEEGRRELRRITRWRRDHQPGGTFNAGSVFKNPPDISAGELIDSLGLKGMSVGDVAVSEKHANFFVAGGNATSEDIAGLVEKVKDRVFEMSGTKLEPEIQFVGFGS